MDEAEPLFQRILELHEQGYGNEEIAQELEFSVEQIDLIVDRYENQNTMLD